MVLAKYPLYAGIFWYILVALEHVRQILWKQEENRSKYSMIHHGFEKLLVGNFRFAAKIGWIWKKD